MAAAYVSAGAQARHNNLFTSVFPTTHFTTPTPEATPNIGSLSSPASTFGGFSDQHTGEEDVVKLTRSWSTATRFLSLSLDPESQSPNARILQEAEHAVLFLCHQPQTRKDLLAWYTNEFSIHFRRHILPQLHEWQHPIPLSAAPQILERTVHILAEAQHTYMKAPSLLTTDDASLHAFRHGVTQKLHNLVLQSLPRQRLQTVLSNVLYHQGESSLQAKAKTEQCAKAGECLCEIDLERPLLTTLHMIGLGETIGERALADASCRLLRGPVLSQKCFAVDWVGHSSRMTRLQHWVEHRFVPSIQQALMLLTGVRHSSENNVKQFTTMAVTALGCQRSDSLFDYVKSWPASMGAVLDLRDYLALSETAHKATLCATFARHIQDRLLHAGASTTEILSIYINVIHAFRVLDARGVLLEKVATPIRTYLRARDDTVSIIAASFLAEFGDEGVLTSGDAEKVCSDITVEVARSEIEDRPKHGLSNWNDMDWVPDPIDAGPGYRASKSEDAIACILGLFEQEDFIKEITTVLAQHLLQVTDTEYVKETKLVELFKSRLDATKLQAAEVMLKDVRDSITLNRKINALVRTKPSVPPTPREVQAAIPEDGITLQSLYRSFEARMPHGQFLAVVKLVANQRHELLYPKRTRLPPEPRGAIDVQPPHHEDFKVQILSSFFWPEMRTNNFTLPHDFTQAQASFEERFSRQGTQRKLLFHPALARVTVELSLEDRDVKESDIPAWIGSVIGLFSREGSDNLFDKSIDIDPAAGFTPQHIMDALSMDEELVTDALNFWIGKRVLYQPSPDTYAVLERLDTEVATTMPQTQMHNAEAISAVKSQDAMLQESASMFSTFIANMLRNGGPKEVGGMMGITNMLKMVLPNFTYGEEEVRWLLSEMEARREVVRNGEVWAVTG